MLKLSKKVDYGLTLLGELAKQPGGWVSLAMVAKKSGISGKFMSQLVIPLRGAGLVVSREGVGGGYKLAKAPKAIKVKQIIDALEGSTALVDCLEEDKSKCLVCSRCGQKIIWKKVQKGLDEILSKLTLANFL